MRVGDWTPSVSVPAHSNTTLPSSDSAAMTETDKQNITRLNRQIMYLSTDRDKLIATIMKKDSKRPRE